MNIMNKISEIFRNQKTLPSRYWPEGDQSMLNGISPTGIHVDPQVALTYSAVWACVKSISDSIAWMPWRIHEEVDGGKRVAKEHPADRLINKFPNDDMDAGTFWGTLIVHALTWGNGYAEITRNAAGRPTGLWIITPDRVKVLRGEDRRLIYQVRNQGAGDVFLPARDVIHLHGLGFDGTQGYSVISLARKGIEMGLATEQYGASFFGQGAHVGGVLMHDKLLSDEAHQHIKESWVKNRSGLINAHKPVILEEGMKYEKLGIPPEDAQFLETRSFQVHEVARWYGVPVHKLAELERTTHNNIEAENIGYVTDTLLPWTRRLESSVDRKVLSPREQADYFSKINLMGLLRGDSKTRSEYYRLMFNIGVMSINEIRALEDMNSMGPAGDFHFMLMNMTTVDRVANGENFNGHHTTQPAPEEGETIKEEQQNSQDVIDAYRRYVEATLSGTENESPSVKFANTIVRSNVTESELPYIDEWAREEVEA